MALGGFDDFTEEQKGKMLLLGFQVYWGGQVKLDFWYAAKVVDTYMRVMVRINNTAEVAKFNSVDELIEAYANDPEKYTWV